MISRNEGTMDRWMRGLLGALLIASGASLVAGGWIVQILGAAVLGTALIGWCPLYSLLHVSTRAVKR